LRRLAAAFLDVKARISAICSLTEFTTTSSYNLFLTATSGRFIYKINTEEELVSTKGVKSLDQHKISAIKGNYQPKHLFDIMSSNLDQGEVYNIM
jgi:hypothetical protein